jgi:predicted phage tail protein
MMRTIHLHGKLKKQFGAKHRFDVATAAEALRALNCNYPGEFVRALQDGCFRVVRGDHRTGMPLSIDLVNDLKLGRADLHIVPVALGAANGKGATKVILGAALIGGAIFMSGGTLAAPLSMMGQPAIAGIGVTWGNIAAVGLGLTLAGASTLLAKPIPQTTRQRMTAFRASVPSRPQPKVPQSR